MHWVPHWSQHLLDITTFLVGLVHEADSVFNDEIGWPLAISRKTVKKYLVDGVDSGIYSGFDQQCAVQCQLGPVLSPTLGRAARWGAAAVRSAGRLSAVGWSC